MSSLETEKGTEAAPLPPPPVACSKYCTVTEVALRVLLLAASIVAVVVMVTSKETEMVPVSPGPRPILAPVPAKFNHSPAFIYFVAALSVAGLYSIITTIASLAVVWKPDVPAKRFLILLAHDVLILGIVASATGTAGGVGYIGLKGNSHVQWNKICSVYSTFCRHVGASIAVALFASVVLVVLVILNAVALFRRTPGGATSSLFW